MSNNHDRPLVVAFVSDLRFTMRIGNVLRGLDYRVKWIESAADLGAPIEEAAVETPGELLTGHTGRLFSDLSRWQPALLLFDLTNAAVPWRQWIAALKASPATRRMPVLCFGPHEDVEALTRAKRIGADAVLARSRFTDDMPALFQQYARRPDSDALQAACDEPLSDLARQGIELHNEGEYFEAHELLEDAWNEDQGPGRDLYQGMLQVSVAYLQIQRGNYRGAVKMCLRVRQWFDKLPDVCRGIDVAALKENVHVLQDALEAAGPEGLDALDPALMRPVPLSS